MTFLTYQVKKKKKIIFFFRYYRVYSFNELNYVKYFDSLK